MPNKEICKKCDVCASEISALHDPAEIFETLWSREELVCRATYPEPPVMSPYDPPPRSCFYLFEQLVALGMTDDE